MLSSQTMLVLQTSKSPLLLQTATTSCMTVPGSTCLPKRSRHQQQVRNFRFSLWSSYLDPNLHKAIQRHRIIKHKYIEAFSGKLSWDRHRSLHSTCWGLKGFTCITWRGQGTRSGRKWADENDLDGARRDLGIEDVKQSAFNKLFGREEPLRPTFRQKAVNKSGVFDWAWYKLDTTPSKPSSSNAHANSEAEIGNRSSLQRGNSIPKEAIESELEYDIDPISNRKAYRYSKERTDQYLNSGVVRIPVEKFKGYQSQFSKFEPSMEYGEGETAHLGGKASKPQSECTDSRVPSTASRQETNEFEDKCHTFQPSTPDQQNKQLPHRANPVGGKPKGRDCSGSFPPGGSSRGNGSCPLFNHGLEKYKPFTYSESDGKLIEQPDSVTQGLNDYDHLYEPFTYNEPDGKSPEQPDPVNVGLSDYDHYYTPFAFNEPDGQLAKKSKLTESSTIRSSSSPNEDSSTSVPKQSVSAKTSLSQPRNSIFHNFNTAGMDKEEDLDFLCASDIRAASGKIKGNEKETTAEKEIRRPAMKAQFNELQISQESHPDEIAAAQNVKDFRQSATNLKDKWSKLPNHNARDKRRVNAKLAKLDSEASLNASLPTSRKLTGTFVRDFPEEFVMCWDSDGSTSKDCLIPKTQTDPGGYEKSLKGFELSHQQEIDNAVQNGEKSYTDSTTAGESQTQVACLPRLQTSLDRSQKTAESKAQPGSYTKEPQDIEILDDKEALQPSGTDARPFVPSHRCAEQNPKPTLEPQNEGECVRGFCAECEKQCVEEFMHEIRNIYITGNSIMSCEHRKLTKEALPSSSTNRDDGEDQSTNQSLKNEFDKGINKVGSGNVEGTELPAMQAIVSEQKKDAAVVAQASSSTPEPTQYKILAYNPMMEAITIAETTSTVSDSSSALTPAEVLLQLSNPAKFFPHFLPLQEQGYEIVSGNGDVLVFRKVHEAVPSSIQGFSASSTTASSTPRHRRVVNPIDGMQCIPEPATGNFASPTGFVNHDFPSEHPFISNIDVRKEEPVFSGRKTTWPEDDWDELDDKPSSQKSRKTSRKLLIGAAWVAACSYAVGVVFEFFKTGGSEGKGPVGF